MSVIFAIIPNFSASVWSLTTVYGLFRKRWCWNFTLLCLLPSLSLAAQKRCPWFWISAARSQHTTSSHREKKYFCWLGDWVEQLGPRLSRVRLQESHKAEPQQAGSSTPRLLQNCHMWQRHLQREGGAGGLTTSLRWIQNMTMDVAVSRRLISVFAQMCECLWQKRDRSKISSPFWSNFMPVFSTVRPNTLWMCIQWDVVWKERLIPVHERPTPLRPVFPRSVKASQSEWMSAMSHGESGLRPVDRKELPAALGRENCSVREWSDSGQDAHQHPHTGEAWRVTCIFFGQKFNRPNNKTIFFSSFLLSFTIFFNKIYVTSHYSQMLPLHDN